MATACNTNAGLPSRASVTICTETGITPQYPEKRNSQGVIWQKIIRNVTGQGAGRPAQRGGGRDERGGAAGDPRSGALAKPVAGIRSDARLRSGCPRRARRGARPESRTCGRPCDLGHTKSAQRRRRPPLPRRLCKRALRYGAGAEAGDARGLPFSTT